MVHKTHLDETHELEKNKTTTNRSKPSGISY
jgi:hypothetical protein